MSTPRKPIPGIRCVEKLYHNVLAIILEDFKQTHAEAAEELEISKATFDRILRLKCLPKFHTDRGQALADRFERWSGVKIGAIFPNAYFTKEFLMMEKTRTRSASFRLLMRAQKSGERFMLPPPTVSPKPSPKRTTAWWRNRKKRKKTHTKVS